MEREEEREGEREREREGERDSARCQLIAHFIRKLFSANFELN